MVVGREGQRLALLRNQRPETLHQRATDACQRIGDRAAVLGRLDPAVVDDTVRHPVVVLGEQRRQVTAGRPADVIPEHRRRVALDQFPDVRGRVGDVIRRVRHGQKAVGGVGQQSVVVGPVVSAGVVQTHAHPGAGHRAAQVADDVAACVVAALAGVRKRGRPQAESVVMFGGEHHVSRSGVAARGSDAVHVSPGGAVVEGCDEIVVGGVRSVGVALVAPGRAALQSAAVEIPLRVRVVAQHLCGPLIAEQLLDVRHLGCPAGHRVQPPVQEDPQLGVVVPVRQGV